MVLGIAANIALEQARQLQRWLGRREQEDRGGDQRRRSPTPNLPGPAPGTPAQGMLRRIYPSSF